MDKIEVIKSHTLHLHDVIYECNTQILSFLSFLRNKVIKLSTLYNDFNLKFDNDSFISFLAKLQNAIYVGFCRS